MKAVMTEYTQTCLGSVLCPLLTVSSIAAVEHDKIQASEFKIWKYMIVAVKFIISG